MIENAKIETETKNDERTESAERVNARLTVEVPTEVKAGALPTHCTCPPDCCT